MTNRRESADHLDEEGSRWVARMDRGLSDGEQEALDRWLEGDPRRLGALSRARAAWFHAERAGALGCTPEPASAKSGQIPRRAVLIGGGALAASVVAGTTATWLLRPSPRIIENAAGEVRRLTLSDGTAVTLDAASRLSVAIDQVRRAVTLLAGQAFFEVARDPLRPFLVLAGGALIRTTSSDFLVRLQPNATCAVLVRTGVVALTARAYTSMAPAVLDTGWQATVPDQPGSSPPQMARIAPQSFDRLLAWREGQLSFAGETLGDAAAQFRRYNSMKIIVSDEALASEPITGLYASDDPEGFARAIAVSLGARVDLQGENIVISRSGAKHG